MITAEKTNNVFLNEGDLRHIKFKCEQSNVELEDVVNYTVANEKEITLENLLDGIGALYKRNVVKLYESLSL